MPPRAVNLTALPSKLSTNRFSLIGSPATSAATSPRIDRLSVNPFASASSLNRSRSASIELIQAKIAEFELVGACFEAGIVENRF